MVLTAASKHCFKMKIIRVKIIPYNAKIVFSKYISSIYIILLLCFIYIYWHSTVVFHLNNARIFNELRKRNLIKSIYVHLMEVDLGF